jgi:periplasmic mercuric ion binding protein
MKKSITLLFLFFLLNANAQEKSKVITSTITVKGNCESCKKRIENAADIKGVKFAEWNTETKILKVTYRKDKVSLEKIVAAVLQSGHDTESASAPDESYNKLPGCCKFRTTQCTEKKD